jgi:DNA-binding SARP family transcriptional activator
VGGPQARAVLAALAIGAGHAVAVDHLHQTLWQNHPPDSADNTLQSYISDLRHILGAAAIVRINHAYQLEVGPQNIDAVRFETLLAQAIAAKDDPEDCLRLCKDALRLWRGRPFGDLGDDESFRLEAYRLDELRLATMELSIEADLALGNNELVVGELEVAIEEHPYREHLWYLLIRALAGRGRRVEALRACRRLRGVLAEVGVDAGDDLLSLEQQILEGHRLSANGTH